MGASSSTVRPSCSATVMPFAAASVSFMCSTRKLRSRSRIRPVPWTAAPRAVEASRSPAVQRVEDPSRLLWNGRCPSPCRSTSGARRRHPVPARSGTRANGMCHRSGGSSGRAETQLACDRSASTRSRHCRPRRGAPAIASPIYPRPAARARIRRRLPVEVLRGAVLRGCPNDVGDRLCDHSEACLGQGCRSRGRRGHIQLYPGSSQVNPTNCRRSLD